MLPLKELAPTVPDWGTVGNRKRFRNDTKIKGNTGSSPRKRMALAAGPVFLREPAERVKMVRYFIGFF